MSHFPTKTDVAFYRAKQEHTLPGWARKLVAEDRGPTPAFMIDHVVNIHGGMRLKSGELAAMNLTQIMRRPIRDLDHRGLIVWLREIAWPARRAAFARKWARRLERGTYRSERAAAGWVAARRRRGAL